MHRSHFNACFERCFVMEENLNEVQLKAIREIRRKLDQIHGLLRFVAWFLVIAVCLPLLISLFVLFST